MEYSSLKTVEHAFHLWCARFDREMHRIVLSEAEEAEKLRRRFHIHLCLLCASGLMSYLAIIGAVSLTLVTGTTTGLLAVQEYIDRVGRF